MAAPIDFASISLSLYLFYYFLCAVHDSWKREVPARIFHCFFWIGLAAFLLRPVWMAGQLSWERILGTALAFLPGLFLYFVSKLSHGELGIGDAYFLLISGCYLPFSSILLLMLLGILTSGLLGIGFLVYGKIRHINMRRKKIPLIPCMLPAIYCIVSEPSLYFHG